MTLVWGVVSGAAVVAAVAGLVCALLRRRAPLTRVAEGQIPPGLQPAMAAFGTHPSFFFPEVFDEHLLAVVLDLSRRGFLRRAPADTDGQHVCVAVTGAPADRLTLHERLIIETVSSQPGGRCRLADFACSGVAREATRALLVECREQGWARRGYRTQVTQAGAMFALIALAMFSLMEAAENGGVTGDASAGGLGGGVAGAVVAAAAGICLAAVWVWLRNTDTHAVTRRGLRAYNDLDRLKQYLQRQTEAARAGDKQALGVLRALLPWVVAFGLLYKSQPSSNDRGGLLDDLAELDEDEDSEAPQDDELELDEESGEPPRCVDDEIDAVREVCGDDHRADVDPRVSGHGSDGTPHSRSSPSGAHDWSGIDTGDEGGGFNH